MIQTALMCKAYGCTPSQLRLEDAQEVERHSLVFAYMMKKMPHMML